MKRLMTMLALLLTIGSAGAKITKKICVPSHIEGTEDLNQLVGNDKYSVDSLVIDGHLQPSDFSFLRDMCIHGVLTGLNLENCEVDGGVIPACAFLPPKVNGTSAVDDGAEKGFRVNLQYINLPHHYFKGIGERAFALTNLRSIEIQRSVENIEAEAFSGCKYLHEVKVRNLRVPQAGSGAFQGLAEDAVLKVPTGTGDAYAKAVGWNDIKNVCESADAYIIKSVVAQGGDLQEQMGQDMYQVDSLSVTGSLKATDFDVLRDNCIFGRLSGLDLSSCSLEDNAIPKRAFVYSREEGHLKDNVHAYNLQYVSFPKDLEYISARAFMYSGLRCIELPASVRTLKSECFFGCVDMRGTVRIPEGMTYLEAQCFTDCYHIGSIYVPSTLDSLVCGALRVSFPDTRFAGKATCDLYVNRMTPPQSKEPERAYGPFGEERGYATWALEGWRLYVPVGAKKNFENMEGWNDIPEIIETPELTGVTASIKGVVDRSVQDGMTEVYTPSGRLVAKGEDLPVLPKGLYIVKTGGQTRKVVLGN